MESMQDEVNFALKQELPDCVDNNGEIVKYRNCDRGPFLTPNFRLALS